MRIALGQINPLVGDVAGNSATIVDFIGQARRESADLVVFPELSVIGYPPKDLLAKPQFVRSCDQAIRHIARQTEGIAALVGLPAVNLNTEGRPLYNAAALLINGQMEGLYVKSLLPTYDVFDESRYFEAGEPAKALPFAGRMLGISICEDLWNEQAVFGRSLYHTNPIAELFESGADLLVNLSASPFEQGKHDVREQLFAAQVARYRTPLVFCNQVGGNDELIFDGASCVFGADGRVLARAKAFEQDLLIVDLDAPADSRVEPYPERHEAMLQALTLGVRDYVRKCGFTDVVIGLSGGIDSALTAAIATEALGPKNVHGVSMPSRYTIGESIRDAEALARNLGISFDVIEIEPLHGAFETQLAPLFAGRQPDVTEENIQARTRGVLLMSLSNKFGWLTLATGNKSELSTGYCTLYGDMCGGLAVIGDVPKSLVYELARHINQRAGKEIIPNSTIVRPPTAELRPDQTDQDSLPPYDVLDGILELYVEQDKSVDQIVAAGFDADMVRRVTRLVDRNEYKRKQAAPVLKVTGRAFGTGRRLPIAASYDPTPPC